MKLLISVSKKSRKKKSARSQFFSILMKELAGDVGDSISNHYIKGNADALKKSLVKVVDNIVNSINAEKK